MNINFWIAKRVRELRKKKHLSQEQLSFECNMCQSFIAHLETKPRRTSMPTVQKICDGLDISIEEFFKGCK